VSEWLSEALPGLVVLLFMLVQTRAWLIELQLRAEIRRLEKLLAPLRAQS
jgi:hypothetical protein